MLKLLSMTVSYVLSFSLYNACLHLHSFSHCLYCTVLLGVSIEAEAMMTVCGQC